MILIYAFEPWGLVTTNVSKELLLRLEKEYEKDKDIKFIVLPVTEDGILALDSFIKMEKPHLIIGMGHVPLSFDFRIETKAYSMLDSKASQIAGYIALQTKTKMTDNMDRLGYCNRSYYTALNHTTNSIFIHVGPYASKKMDVLAKVKEIIKVCKEVQYK